VVLEICIIYYIKNNYMFRPKHVVVLYVINYTYLYHHIVVLDKYTHSNLVYYKNNWDDEPYDYCFFVSLYEGKSLNNRNFILNCMEKYAQRKILFRDTKWLLSNMSYRGRDDQAV